MDHQDNAQTLNATSTDEVGLSSSPDSLNDRPDVSGTGISTVDDPPVKDADTGKTAEELKAEADAAKAKEAEAEKAKADAETGKDGGEPGPDEDKTGKKGQEGRFDQHPDWIRMREERDQAVLKAAKYEGMIEGLTKPKDADVSSDGDPNLPKPLMPYKDITKMTKEELVEWFEDDPVGYEANRYAQFMHERDILEYKRNKEVQKTNSVKGTFEEYEKSNPDFKVMWDSGEIKKFMDAHPGHNAISAHLILTKEAAQKTLEDKIKEAVDKAIKETTEKVTADFRAKRNADVIGDGGGGAKPKTGADELKDTKSQGGLVSAIAARLQQRRQAASGG